MHLARGISRSLNSGQRKLRQLAVDTFIVINGKGFTDALFTCVLCARLNCWQYKLNLINIHMFVQISIGECCLLDHSPVIDHSPSCLTF